MLIDFRKLLPKYGITPRGVLHIGANVGEEFDVYMELGIENQIWFEPNPVIFEKLIKNISSNPNALAFGYCVGEENKNVVLHESNNAGQSSSILPLGTHKDVHPDVHYVNDIRVEMVRMDTFFQGRGVILGNKPISFLDEIDFLNIDIQGAELMALKGMGDYIKQFKAAYLEVNKAHLYEGCALVEEIDEYLSQYGFERVETLWAGDTNWGDALYVKKIPARFESIPFNVGHFDFVSEINKLFETESLEDLHSDQYKEQFKVGADSITEFHNKFYDKYRAGWTEMESLYEYFIKHVVAPRYNEDFLYQKFPTFRVHLSGNVAVGAFHTDAEFGHPAGEENYILPLTHSTGTASVWVESQAGMEDFEAIPLVPGNLIMFKGNTLRHGNKVNETAKTRVSMDFRILPISKYDPANSSESITKKAKFKEGDYYKKFSKK